MQFAAKSGVAVLLFWPVVCFIAARAPSPSNASNQQPLTVAINNRESRRDTNGRILDAHDGPLE
jgi:hypothetical protein